jgi:hypothetical protein
MNAHHNVGYDSAEVRKTAPVSTLRVIPRVARPVPAFDRDSLAGLRLALRDDAHRPGVRVDPEVLFLMQFVTCLALGAAAVLAVMLVVLPALRHAWTHFFGL